jgi:Ras-related protein Rab-2A
VGHCRAGELQVHHPFLLQEVPSPPRSSIVAILVFDVTSPQSFENLQKWLDEIKNNATENIRVVVVGNKTDLSDRRTVRKEVAQEFASNLGVPYFETSAKSGSNVCEIFTEPAKQLISDIESKRLIVNNAMVAGD